MAARAENMPIANAKRNMSCARAELDMAMSQKDLTAFNPSGHKLKCPPPLVRTSILQSAHSVATPGGCYENQAYCYRNRLTDCGDPCGGAEPWIAGG
jgi:hypothetical protein